MKHDSYFRFQNDVCQNEIKKKKNFIIQSHEQKSKHTDDQLFNLASKKLVINKSKRNIEIKYKMISNSIRSSNEFKSPLSLIYSF